jgi:hypothetical protein
MSTSNPAIYLCGVLCGLPAFVTGLVILYFRVLARRHITITVDRSTPVEGLKRIAFAFDLETRKPRSPKQTEREDE